MYLRPIVVDIDGSVGAQPEERRMAMSGWQERLRFGCSQQALERFGVELDSLLGNASRLGTVLLGSGDFHHLSQLLIARQLKYGQQPFDVVVFDNHPDNMVFPVGTHCGSWVGPVASLAGVSHVHVVGVTSGDVGWMNAWQNRLGPLRRGKLTYWCVGNQTKWTAYLGMQEAVRDFEGPDQLVDAFCSAVHGSHAPIYLSIDKDVFSADVVQTNWDQGRLLEQHARSMIGAMAGRVIGSDITGDVSAYRYLTHWKRWLSWLDGQSEPSAVDLERWRPGHRALDQRLLGMIDASSAPI